MAKELALAVDAVQPMPDPVPVDVAGLPLVTMLDEPGYPIDGTALLVMVGDDAATVLGVG